MLNTIGSLSLGAHGGCCTSGPSNKDCSRHAVRLRWKCQLCCKDVSAAFERQLSACSQNCDGPGTLWRKIEPLLIVAPCVIAAAWLAMLFWIKQLYAEFG